MYIFLLHGSKPLPDSCSYPDESHFSDLRFSATELILEAMDYEGWDKVEGHFRSAMTATRKSSTTPALAYEYRYPVSLTRMCTEQWTDAGELGGGIEPWQSMGLTIYKHRNRCVSHYSFFICP